MSARPWTGTWVYGRLAARLKRQHELGPGGRRRRARRRVRRRPPRGTRPAGRGAQHDLGGRRPGPFSGGIAIPSVRRCRRPVLVMERLDGHPGRHRPGTPVGVRAALARGLLDCLLHQVMLEGTFHADPHPATSCCGRRRARPAGLRVRRPHRRRAAQGAARLLLALDRGDPAGLADALLEVVERPGELDEPRLEQMLGRFLARRARTRDHPRHDHVHRPIPHRLRARAGGTTGDRRGVPGAGHDGGHPRPSPPASTSWPKPAG